MSDSHTFKHEAMKTTFTLRLIHAQAKHASDAANQAFALIDEIENASAATYLEATSLKLTECRAVRPLH